MSSNKGQLRIHEGVSLSNFHRRPANGENYSRKFLQKRSVGGNYSEKFLQKRSVGGNYSRKHLQKRSVGRNYSRKRLQKRSVGGIYSGGTPSKEIGWRKLLGEIPSKEIGWRNLLGGNAFKRDQLAELTRGERLQKGSGGGNVAIEHSFSCLNVGKWSKRASRRQGGWPNGTGTKPVSGAASHSIRLRRRAR